MRLLRRVSVRRVIAFCAVTFAASGCAPRSATTQPTPLPAVSPAPKSALPAWIVSLSPTGEAKDGAQIRVRFANDVVPVEALESPDRSAALSHVLVEPALPGRFIFLTPRMIGFESDRRVPHGTRVRVTLTAGLADLAGHRLTHDLAWSFTTQPLDFPDFDGGASPAPGPFVPRIAFDASDAVDVPSLLAHATLTDTKDRSVIGVAIAPTPSPDPSASPTPASDADGSDSGPTTVRYEVVPKHPLAYDRTYTFSIGAGVLSQGGNLPTQGEYDRFVRSYGPFVYRGPQTRATTPERFVESVPTLGFSNPIDPASLAAAVTISPPAARGDLASVDDDGAIALDPDLLEPDTTYVVRIARSLRDRFGQTLGTAVSETLRTTSLQPNLGAPSGAHIFPAGLDLALNVGSVNLPERAFRAAYVRVRPEELVAHDVAQSDGVAALLPAATDWRAHPLAQVRNVQLDTALPLRSLAGGTHGMVAYGVRAKTVRTTDANGKQGWVEPEYDGAVQLTDLGVWTQWFPGAGEVRVRRLSDGTAVAGAAVAVYESFTEYGVTAPSTPAQPCASGTTGADGRWSLPLAAWAACASTAKNATAAPALLTVVRSGDDWAYARSTSYENGYGAGLSGEGWSAGTPNARGSLVSDRTLYQPGETAKFVGVSYFERDGTIARGRSTSFALVATSPSGATRNLGSATPDAFGTFSVSFALPASAAVGAWQIAATGTDGETLAGAFTVAEFKPPNFKVDLTLDEGPVVAGATVGARARSSYLFGAAVGAGTARVSVTRARTTFSPAGYDEFSFGRQWSYPEEEPSVTSDVLQRAFPLDATGETAFAVPVGNDLPFPMAYTVTSETTDASNLAVADTKSFVALPSKDEIGLATPFVGEAGRAFSVRTVVVDPSGKPRDGVALRLVLQQRVDASAPQIVEGSETSHDAVRYVDVATSTVTSGAQPVDVPFTAPKAGEYRIRANVAGAQGDLTATDAPLWISGAGGAAWFGADSDALVVKLDKTTYRPGDVARVLVQSPYADADMSLAVVRHGAFLRRTTLVHGAAPEATFVVTPDMLPNAAVQVVLVRRGAPLAHGVPAGVTKLARTGFAPFDVALDAKYLHVDLHPHAASVAPGGRERIDVRVTASDGAPVRGELTVAVVNDAILQLSGYRFPDLVKSVYATEPISTRLADNYGDVELRTERASLDKGFGYGGGVMAGPAGTRVRTKFLPLAYWNAAVRTDATGRATIDVPLPDDLTRWRVMALALTRDARFGNGETTLVARKPLV
ncbi:MAG: alpha-2-macroglobulin family protein, partial [Candidatus Eremiobacteraeota bacterium]|nr:alpha-2-macroglobulin family protein [Candidatus Eremiobacteraeota bacterium]